MYTFAVKIFVSQTYLFYKNISHTQNRIQMYVGNINAIDPRDFFDVSGSRQGLLGSLISMGIRFAQGLQGV